MSVDLSRKLLEMELRMELELVQDFPSGGEWPRKMKSWEMDCIVEHLLPFIQEQIRLAKEGQR